MTGKVKGSTVMVRLPLLAGLTYNEVHSLVLGAVGLLAGTAYRLGMQQTAAGFTLFVVAVAFGLRRTERELPIAQRVVKNEPWYFLASFVVTAGAAVLVPPVL